MLLCPQCTRTFPDDEGPTCPDCMVAMTATAPTDAASVPLVARPTIDTLLDIDEPQEIDEPQDVDPEPSPPPMQYSRPEDDAVDAPAAAHGANGSAQPAGDASASAQPANAAVKPPTVEQDDFREIEALVAEGHSIYLIAGIPKSGKTQLLDAVAEKSETLEDVIAIRRPAGKKTGGRVGPTDVGKFEPLKVRSGKSVIIDASGERYSQLYPELREGGEIHEGDIRLLEVVGSLLGGLIILIDLKSLWQSANPASPGARQEHVALWVLDVMRCLRSRRSLYDSNLTALSLRKRVEALEPEAPLLDVPVLVLFSKADEAADLEIPDPNQRASGGAARWLEPYRDSPFFLAYHHLRTLHTGLLRRVRHFRYDFVHSFATTREGIIDLDPCGVVLSMEWLFDPRWRRRAISTRQWIRVQRWLDTLTGRGRRWSELPANGPS